MSSRASLLLSSLAVMATCSAPALAQVTARVKPVVVEISVGDNVPMQSRNRDYAFLAQRVRMLEMAVLQLQDQVFALSTRHEPHRREPRTSTCFIKGTFETFTGKGDSRGEAKAAVIDTCQKGAHMEADCAPEKAQCE